ncbi:hypothetical protein BRC93_15640 [Halobacteriales archaeon QS_5_70_15]|nr:MAG: hypothetical protein BRC93_15640 [Halobacteriales archaeon QS_5_70_15]
MIAAAVTAVTGRSVHPSARLTTGPERLDLPNESGVSGDRSTDRGPGNRPHRGTDVSGPGAVGRIRRDIRWGASGPEAL